MIALTLCTSTSQGSLVLSQEGRILKEKVWLKEKSHSEKITTELQDLFEGTGVQIKDVNLLICTKGPGSFTGIRVGLSVVKALSYAYKIPVIAIDDGLALSLNALPEEPHVPILVMLDAQKNKVFLAVYQLDQQSLREITQPTLVGLDELQKYLPENQYLCLGDGFSHFAEHLAPEIKNKLIRESKISDFPLATTIFSYVFPLKSVFEKIDGLSVEPLYLRSSAAEEVWAEKNKSKNTADS